MDKTVAFVSFLVAIVVLGLIGAITSGVAGYHTQQAALAKACIDQQGSWVTPNTSQGICLFARAQ